MLYSALYKASVANTETVSGYVKATQSSLVRGQISLDSNLVRQFMAVHNDNIILITRTRIRSDSVAIAAWGDETNNVCPIVYNPDTIQQTFISLTPKAVAERFELPTATKDPVSMNPGSGAEQPGPDRLHFPFTNQDESPVIATFPLLLPIPVGISIPADKPMVDIKESDVPNYPLAMYWINAIKYIIEHNEGKSLSAQDGLFKKDDITGAINEPFPAENANIPAPTQLPPNDVDYKFVVNTIQDDIAAVNPPPVESTTAPPNSSPSATNESMAKALVDAINSSSLGKQQESKSDAESNKEFNDAVIKYQLLFAIRNSVLDTTNDRDQEDICAVSYPEITEEFKEVLRASKLSNKTALMQDLMEAHLGTLKNNSDSYLDQGATIQAAMFDSVLTGSLCNFLWSTKPLASDLDSIKSRVNPFHFATPRPRSYQYKERTEHGRLLQQQELAEEDVAKRERKATELYHDGQVRSYHDVHAVLCNLHAFGTFIVGSVYPQTFLARVLRKYDKVLRSTSAQIWLNHNHKIDHLAHSLVLDIANQVYPFAEVASRLDYRNAIKTGKLIDPQAFVGPYNAGLQIANKLSNLVPYVHLGDYSNAPYTFELFQNKKKTTEKQPSDTNHNNAKRNEKREDMRTDNKRGADKKSQAPSPAEKKQKHNNLGDKKASWFGEATLDSLVSPSARNTRSQERHQSCVLLTSSTMSVANGATSVS